MSAPGIILAAVVTVAVVGSLAEVVRLHLHLRRHKTSPGVVESAGEDRGVMPAVGEGRSLAASGPAEGHCLAPEPDPASRATRE